MKKLKRKIMSMDKVLLDTTYLLPIFGISVNLKNFEKHFPKLLTTSDVLYTPVSIVEAKWVILRLTKKTHESNERKKILNAYRIGLRILFGDGRLTQTYLTNPDIEEIADQLLIDVNISDFFDRIIHATVIHYDTVLLTEDQELLYIIKNNQLPKLKEVITWSDAIRRLTKVD